MPRRKRIKVEDTGDPPFRLNYKQTKPQMVEQIHEAASTFPYFKSIRTDRTRESYMRGWIMNSVKDDKELGMQLLAIWRDKYGEAPFPAVPPKVEKSKPKPTVREIVRRRARRRKPAR